MSAANSNTNHGKRRAPPRGSPVKQSILTLYRDIFGDSSPPTTFGPLLDDPIPETWEFQVPSWARSGTMPSGPNEFTAHHEKRVLAAIQFKDLPGPKEQPKGYVAWSQQTFPRGAELLPPFMSSLRTEPLYADWRSEIPQYAVDLVEGDRQALSTLQHRWDGSLENLEMLWRVFLLRTLRVPVQESSQTVAWFVRARDELGEAGRRE
jgi:hypothetical protein